MEPLAPHVIVLFGATGDLAQRKLLPGLLHLSAAGLMPECRIVGTSLDDLDDEAFRDLARRAVEKFSSREITDEQWARYANRLTFVPQQSGPDALARAVAEAEEALGSAETSAASTTSASRRPPRSTWCACSTRPAWSSGPASSWRSRSAPTSSPPSS